MDDLRYQVDLLTALNEKLGENERIYNLVLESSSRINMYVDCTTNTVKTFGRWKDFFDIRINDMSDIFKFIEMFHEEDRDELRNLFYVEKTGLEYKSIEVRSKNSKVWYIFEAHVFYDEYKNPVEKIITIGDITRPHTKREELAFLAYYDNLTNLYNRNYFISKLKAFVEKAIDNKEIVSVLLVDIDDFHKISDSRGLIIGDEIIQDLGLFINTLTNENVIASRFDGDIYCIAIYDPCGNRSVESIYRSITEFLSEPIKLTDGTETLITVTVGVAEYPEATDNPLALINCAEVVMLKAKDKGKDQISYYDSAIIKGFLRDVEIENKLKDAINDNKLYMNYQPQYYSETNRLRGVEALIRWRDYDGNLINPGIFIPIAEKNGYIISIGDFVLDECIRQYMDWKKKFDYDMILSINISSIQYNRPDFVPKILATIEKYGMNPNMLELEITESVLIDDLSSITNKMYELKDYGIKVSLDDFGTGFSSLSYLKGLPIDTLKIDKTFIDNVSFDAASRVITEAIVTMSKKLGFKTVAEGVETKEQLDYLKEISCDLIQGFYLGRPLGPDKIEELLLREI